MRPAAAPSLPPYTSRAMQMTTTPGPKSTVLLEVELPPERLTRSIDDAVRRLAKRVRVPGFRPGKAPRPVLERHLAAVPHGGRRLVAFLGSTIGNLYVEERRAFLGALADQLDPQGQRAARRVAGGGLGALDDVHADCSGRDGDGNERIGWHIHAAGQHSSGAPAAHRSGH